MAKELPDPWAEAARRGLAVYHVDLHGLDGLNADGGVIFLQKGMTERDEISTLWHELGHDERGEVHVADASQCKAERAADLYAAEKLVDPQELARLASLYPDDPGLIAYELGVADWVLDAYLRAHPLVADLAEAAA